MGKRKPPQITGEKKWKGRGKESPHKSQEKKMERMVKITV
jgi:hypothetical protein